VPQVPQEPPQLLPITEHGGEDKEQQDDNAMCSLLGWQDQHGLWRSTKI